MLSNSKYMKFGLKCFQYLMIFKTAQWRFACQINWMPKGFNNGEATNMCKRTRGGLLIGQKFATST